VVFLAVAYVPIIERAVCREQKESDQKSLIKYEVVFISVTVLTAVDALQE